MVDEATSSQPKERLIRAFVSSTFLDMQAERDVLIKRVSGRSAVDFRLLDHFVAFGQKAGTVDRC